MSSEWLVYLRNPMVDTIQDVDQTSVSSARVCLFPSSYVQVLVLSNEML